MTSKSNTSSLAVHKKQIFWIVVILGVALVLGGLLLSSSPAVPNASDAHGEHGGASEHEDEGHSDENTEDEGGHGHDEEGADSDHEVGAAEKDEHDDGPEGAAHAEAAEVELDEGHVVGEDGDGEADAVGFDNDGDGQVDEILSFEEAEARLDTLATQQGKEFGRWAAAQPLTTLQTCEKLAAAGVRASHPVFAQGALVLREHAAREPSADTYVY